jgi:TonB family protein
MNKLNSTKIILMAILAGSLFWFYYDSSSSQSTKLNASIVSKSLWDTAQKSEEETIRKVIESETAAITNLCDFEKWADHWWHESYTFFSLTFPKWHVGLRGWSDIAAWGKQTAADCTPNEKISHKYDYRYKIAGDMAFVTFLENEGNESTRVLEKRNGQWKLIQMGVIGTAVYESLAAHQRQEMERAKMKPYDKPPKPIGGIAALQKNLVYPEEARYRGIEGMVILEILINENGKVEDTRVVKSLNADCDIAAVSAIQKTRWEPAEKEGKPIKTWTGVPVTFRITP